MKIFQFYNIYQQAKKKPNIKAKKVSVIFQIKAWDFNKNIFSSKIVVYGKACLTNNYY